MTIGLALAIYIAGFVLVAVFTLSIASREPTAHGQSIIIPIGCMASVLWPIALVYLIVVSIVIAIRTAWQKLSGGPA